jgi:ribosomal protein L32
MGLADKAKEKAFGTCGTCGKTNTPGHTCKVKFSKRGFEAMQKRKDK